jgi:hypothetical protein
MGNHKSKDKTVNKEYQKEAEELAKITHCTIHNANFIFGFVPCNNFNNSF